MPKGRCRNRATGEVLIRVEAAGVNRPDVLQRAGIYPPPPGASPVLGLEVSGTIAACGNGVEALERRGQGLRAGAGRRLCRILRRAGSALSEGAARSRPAEAAGLPETFFTVWTNVFDRGRLASGETFLVHGGTSGIGTTAIQLARAFGAHVFATAGTPEKCAVCVELGAERAIDYRNEDLSPILKEATGGHGVDVILDMVGGPMSKRTCGRWRSRDGWCRSRFCRAARSRSTWCI